MKTPLRFQVTEYDCGTISLLNAFSFLFERNEIPVELIRAIHLYTLDCADEKGVVGAGGTSKEAISKLTHWVTRYANTNDFNVKCERLEKEEVTLDKMVDCLQHNGCVFINCWQLCEHYVIITKIDKKYAYIFDSYYLDKDEYKKDSQVKIIFNKPFSYNRKVSLKRLFSETKKDFSLGKVER
jgi:hypothetical protein